ncbi:MAG: shikimate kinase [Gammaproteobacteria bacterium]|nr:shikimate kinase [Gammaproteobacteria bacterium]
MRQFENIYLIGPMGVGKSTIGRQLAKSRDWVFLDSDREIESRTGVTISTVFEYEGEAGFRKREHAVISDMVKQSQVVLATGGGAVLNDSNRKLLSDNGFVVYLTCSIDKLMHRTRCDTERPLLQTSDRRKRIEEIVKAREPLYLDCANYVLNTGEYPTRSAINLIWSEFDKNRN